MKPSLSIFIGISAILIIFILPFGIHLDLGPGPNSLVAMIWETPLEPAWYTIRYLSAFQFYFQFIFFRLIFFAEICLLLIGKYNKISFILLGIVSELIPLLISIPGFFIRNTDGDNLLTIILPIPFLLIFDLILVQLVSKLKSNNNNDKI